MHWAAKGFHNETGKATRWARRTSNGRRWIFSTSPKAPDSKNTIEGIAKFLCRSRREMIAELERSDELARRIEESAANAQPE
jgi:hypothetical protein